MSVVTCPGQTFASRQSLCQLSNIGFVETIAGSVEEYEEIAVTLAEDLPRLSQIRAPAFSNRWSASHCATESDLRRTSWPSSATSDAVGCNRKRPRTVRFPRVSRVRGVDGGSLQTALAASNATKQSATSHYDKLSHPSRFSASACRSPPRFQPHPGIDPRQTVVQW